MRVKDILKTKGRETITTTEATPVYDAMCLLVEHKISCLPVVNTKHSLVGIISDKDIFHRVHKDPNNFREATVGELMSTDVIVGVRDDDVAYIAGVMTNNRIRHVPIVENDKLIGLISVGDVVKTQMEHIQIENRYLKQFIDGNYPG